jgi:hypothetical protein
MLRRLPKGPQVPADGLRHGWPEATARAYLLARSRGVCEICGVARAAEYSHRQPRNKVSGWCPCDALHLCHDCHADRVHGQPKVARMYGWVISRHAVRGVRFEAVWLPPLNGWFRLDCLGGRHNAADPNF